VVDEVQIKVTFSLLFVLQRRIPVRLWRSSRKFIGKGLQLLIALLSELNIKVTVTNNSSHLRGRYPTCYVTVA
jgi:hypothetical protein